MRLLVSVSDAADAVAATLGGADIIDAKDPQAGPLGAVTPEVFTAISRAVAGIRPLSAALGDARAEAGVAGLTSAFTTAGASFVKIGFVESITAGAAQRLLRRARDTALAHSSGPHTTGVIGVAYADRHGGVPPMDLIEVAVRAGAAGVLLDTADKDGATLTQLMPADTLACWVRMACSAGLLTTLAGRLSAADLPLLRDVGVDIVGVRGAACDHGRQGRVNASRVSLLKAACGMNVERAEA